MSALNPEKLHVRFRRGAAQDRLDLPRRYTLTHSDLTGELYLTIGMNYDRRQTGGLYTRLMRDEVQAEWLEGSAGLELHVYCHVSGGLVVGPAKWRYEIFQTHLPQVLQAFRYAERRLIAARPDLDRTPVFVHFAARQKRFRKVEAWGTLAEYRVGERQPEPGA